MDNYFCFLFGIPQEKTEIEAIQKAVFNGELTDKPSSPALITSIDKIETPKVSDAWKDTIWLEPLTYINEFNRKDIFKNEGEAIEYRRKIVHLMKTEGLRQIDAEIKAFEEMSGETDIILKPLTYPKESTLWQIFEPEEIIEYKFKIVHLMKTELFCL